MTGGLKNWFWALASIVALAIPSTAAASSKAQEPATWFCYVAAEVTYSKGVVISPVFDWYGVGDPPRNITSSEFEEYSSALMPAANWPTTRCFKDRSATEESRNQTINRANQMGGAVVEQYYVYEGDYDGY